MKKGNTTKRMDTYLKNALGLSDRVIAYPRLFDGTWDPGTEQFVPSTRPLRSLVRSALEVVVRIDKYPRQTKKQRKPRH
jgi:hypothetical protein